MLWNSPLGKSLWLILLAEVQKTNFDIWLEHPFFDPLPANWKIQKLHALSWPRTGLQSDLLFFLRLLGLTVGKGTKRGGQSQCSMLVFFSSCRENYIRRLGRKEQGNRRPWKKILIDCSSVREWKGRKERVSTPGGSFFCGPRRQQSLPCTHFCTSPGPTFPSRVDLGSPLFAPPHLCE